MGVRFVLVRVGGRWRRQGGRSSWLGKGCCDFKGGDDGGKDGVGEEGGRRKGKEEGKGGMGDLGIGAERH